MSMIDIIKSEKLKFRNRKKLRSAKSAIIDSKDKFEGNNFIGKNAVVKDCEIGFASYIAYESYIEHCQIGKYCCIGPCVKTITGKHPIEFAAMHPFFYSKNNQIGKSYVNSSKYDEHDYVDDERHYQVSIGNDVWIGNSVKIMAGVHIGNGAVIAAGAIVVNDVEPYSIVGGIPAKVIKWRFPSEIITRLENIKWWNFDEAVIKKNADLFEDVEQMLMCFEKEENE